MNYGLLTQMGRAALGAKIEPDETLAEGLGGSKAEAGNEVWLNLHLNRRDGADFPDFVVARR